MQYQNSAKTLLWFAVVEGEAYLLPLVFRTTYFCLALRDQKGRLRFLPFQPLSLLSITQDTFMAAIVSPSHSALTF